MIGRRYVRIGMSIGLGIFIAVGALVSVGAISIADLNTGAPCVDPGQVLVWGGASGYRCEDPDNPSTVATVKDEFYSGTTNCATGGLFFTGGITGTSACGYNNADTIHMGLLSLTTSTGATDGIRMATQTNSVVFGTVPRCVTWLWKIHNLSDANTQYIDRVGYAEPTAPITDSVDAVEAVYDWAGNGNVHKWQLTTRSNSVGTNTVCTGSTGDISADTWYKLKTCVNAAGTSATLTVNDVLCATNSATIPTGTARGTAIGLQHANNTGAVPIAQLSFVDFVKEVVPFQVAR